MILRLMTYLAPSVPLGLFRELSAYLADAIGALPELLVDETRSGPRDGEIEPFSTAEADVAFVCSTSYVWLADRRPPPAELLGVATVPADRRAAGRPVYFADVVSRAGGEPASFAGVRSFACNDRSSLSGYYSLLFRARQEGLDRLPEIRMSGSHLSSLGLVLSGEVDAAAIDSTVLALQRRARPEQTRGLRVLESWGPHPVQPVVVRAGLDPPLRAALRRALLRAHREPGPCAALSEAGLLRFGEVDDAHYQPVRDALAREPVAAPARSRR